MEVNFQPVFDYIDEKLGEQSELLRSELALKEDVRRIQETLDSFATGYKNYGDNLKVVENKACRLETWALKVAEKTETPYEA
jgi:hypothetical protein